MAALFEMVNHAAAYDAINIAQDFRGLEYAICYGMEMVGHYHIGIDGEAARLARFIESVAGNDLNSISAKYWKAVLGYGSDI
jgi:hypothetical protein